MLKRTHHKVGIQLKQRLLLHRLDLLDLLLLDPVWILQRLRPLQRALASGSARLFRESIAVLAASRIVGLSTREHFGGRQHSDLTDRLQIGLAASF